MDDFRTKEEKQVKVFQGSKGKAMRTFLFSNRDGTSFKEDLDIPGEGLHKPKYVVYKGKLYHSNGAGMTALFYYEVELSIYQNLDISD